MDQNKINFSDDEEEIVEEENQEESDYEMDDEMRAYIYQLTVKSSINDNFDYSPDVSYGKKKKKKRERKRKEKKVIKLDFNKTFEQPDKQNTWKSKRLVEKGKTKKEYKFKPRMVPYEYRSKDNKSVLNVENKDDFPEL